MGWTLGIEPLWLVQWDYPVISYLYQLVQWYGMDTWNWAPLVGIMGLSHNILPVPIGTMVRDGHLGLSPSGWYNGIIPPVPIGTMVRDGHFELSASGWYSRIIPGCPTCTSWYNGTGWTLGIELLWLVYWDYPRMSYCTSWYNSTGWTLGIELLWLV